eukprot:602236_1
MANEEHLDGKFGAIQEEIIDTTHKLKTLWKKYQDKTAELKDLEEENLLEEKELSENIKALTRQFQLKSTILEYFIPLKWLEFIEEHSEWDAEIDQWRIPVLEYSGNNMLRQRVMNEEEEEENDERPLTNQRMTQIWKRVKMLSEDADDKDLMFNKRNNDMQSDEMSNGGGIGAEIQEAIHIAINTNMDPNQYSDKLYLSYGVVLERKYRKRYTLRSIPIWIRINILTNSICHMGWYWSGNT